VGEVPATTTVRTRRLDKMRTRQRQNDLLRSGHLGHSACGLDLGRSQLCRLVQKLRQTNPMVPVEVHNRSAAPGQQLVTPVANLGCNVTNAGDVQRRQPFATS